MCHLQNWNLWSGYTSYSIFATTVQNTFFFSPNDDVFVFLHMYVCSFYFPATLLQKEWRQNMFFFFLLIARDALN